MKKRYQNECATLSYIKKLFEKTEHIPFEFGYGERRGTLCYPEMKLVGVKEISCGEKVTGEISFTPRSELSLKITFTHYPSGGVPNGALGVRIYQPPAMA